MPGGTQNAMWSTKEVPDAHLDAGCNPKETPAAHQDDRWSPKSHVPAKINAGCPSRCWVLTKIKLGALQDAS